MKERKRKEKNTIKKKKHVKKCPPAFITTGINKFSNSSTYVR